MAVMMITMIIIMIVVARVDFVIKLNGERLIERPIRLVVVVAVRVVVVVFVD